MIISRLLFAFLVTGSLALNCSRREYPAVCGKEIQIANSYFCNKVYLFGEGNNEREVVYSCGTPLENPICLCGDGYVRFHGECMSKEDAETKCEDQFGELLKVECSGENEAPAVEIRGIFEELAIYSRDLFCVQPIHRGSEFGIERWWGTRKHFTLRCSCKSGYVRYQGKCATKKEANRVCLEKLSNRALLAPPKARQCPEKEESITCGRELRARNFAFCRSDFAPINSHYHCQPVPECLCKENYTRVHGVCIADPIKQCEAKSAYELACSVSGCEGRLPVSAKCEDGKVVDVVSDECKLDPKNPLSQHIQCECPFGTKKLEDDDDCKTQRQLELECENRRNKDKCPRNEKLDVCGTEIHFTNSYFCSKLFSFGDYQNEREVFYPCDRPLNDPICFCPQGFVRYHGECVTKEEAEEKCNAQFGVVSDCSGENEAPGSYVGDVNWILAAYGKDLFCAQPFVTPYHFQMQPENYRYSVSKYKNLTCTCKDGFVRYQGKCVTIEEANRACLEKLNKRVLIAQPESLQCPENEEAKTCGSEMRYDDLGFCFMEPKEILQRHYSFCQAFPECVCKENTTRVYGECVPAVLKLCQPLVVDSCRVTTCQKLPASAKCVEGKVVDVVPVEECKFNGTEVQRDLFQWLQCKCPPGMKILEGDDKCKTQRQVEIECETRKTGKSKQSPLWSL